MDRYTVRQVNRALVQEQLLQRLDQGERFEDLCQTLNLSLSRDYLPQLRRRYREGGATWQALIDHRHGHVYKLTSERRTWLCDQKRHNPALTQQQLAERFQAEFQVSLSQSQVSNLLRAEGVALPGGQRYQRLEAQILPIDRAGVFFPSSGGAADESAEHGDPGGAGSTSDLPRT